VDHGNMIGEGVARRLGGIENAHFHDEDGSDSGTEIDVCMMKQHSTSSLHDGWTPTIYNCIKQWHIRQEYTGLV